MRLLSGAGIVDEAQSGAVSNPGPPTQEQPREGEADHDAPHELYRDGVRERGAYLQLHYRVLGRDALDARDHRALHDLCVVWECREEVRRDGGGLTQEGAMLWRSRFLARGLRTCPSKVYRAGVIQEYI